MPRYDPLTREERSERMSRVRSANTKPELAVRRLLYSMGYRYRLHPRSLPGNPDLVFFARQKAIFIHGCFWHQHGCRQYRMPRTRRDFWVSKLKRNKLRDGEVQRQLQERGWGSLVIWECQLKDMTKMKEIFAAFLEALE